MAGRKTIMVDEAVWKKIDSFKHRNCMNSIGEAISDAVSSLISSKYYAGIYAASEENYVVEAVGRTEEETIREFIDNYDAEDLGFLKPEEAEAIFPEAKNKDRRFELDHFIVECTREMYYEYLLFSQRNKKHGWIPCSCHLKGEKGERIADTLTLLNAAKTEKFYALVDFEKKLVVNVGRSEFQMQTAYLTNIMEAMEDRDEFDSEKLLKRMENIKTMECTPEFASDFIRFTQPFGPLNMSAIYRIVKNDDGVEIIDTTPKDKFYVVISYDSYDPEEERELIIRGVGRTAAEAKHDFMNRLPEELAEIYNSWDPYDDLEEADETWDPTNWNANDAYTEWKNDANDWFGDLIIMECSRDLYAGVIASDWYEKCKEGYTDRDKEFELIHCEIEENDGVRKAI